VQGVMVLIKATYVYGDHPANPNGSDYDANYPSNRKDDVVTPWLEAFVSSRM